MTWLFRLSTAFIFYIMPIQVLVIAQDVGDSTTRVHLSGFVDIFYVYDFNEPDGETRQPFFYNHNRHNEVNLNLGYIKLSVDNRRYRANVALQGGTYARDNYAQEPAEYRNIYQANAGVALNKVRSTWLDAGIFTSHIGFESAVSSDNWTLTRSLIAENSPYYLTGLKLTHAPAPYLSLSLIACNGWQRIKRLPGNSLPGFGTQVYYEKGWKVVNWNTFIGTDDPDSTRRMRVFSNFYTRLNFNDKAGLIIGFDTGVQQKERESRAFDLWYSPVAIFRHVLNENWVYSLRAEYYSDPSSVIISPGDGHGFKVSGYSINIDYRPFEKLVCRTEVRWLQGSRTIFERRKSYVSTDVFVAGSLAISF